MIVGPAAFAAITGAAVGLATDSVPIGLAAACGLLWASVLAFTVVLTTEEGKDRRGRAISEGRARAAEAAERLLRELREVDEEGP